MMTLLITEPANDCLESGKQQESILMEGLTQLLSSYLELQPTKPPYKHTYSHKSNSSMLAMQDLLYMVTNSQHNLQSNINLTAICDYMLTLSAVSFCSPRYGMCLMNTVCLYFFIGVMPPTHILHSATYIQCMFRKRPV